MVKDLLSHMATSYTYNSKKDLDSDIRVLGEDDPNIITYSKSRKIILSKVGSGNGIYSGFYSRDSLMVPYSTIKLLKEARQDGAREIMYVGGERPDQFPYVRSTLDLWGFDSYVDYVYTVCELGFLEGLIAVIDIGFLTPLEMKKMFEISALIKVMQDYEDNNLYVALYGGNRKKKHELRARSLHWAGKLGFPTLTGILVGMGETMSHRKAALEYIASIHREYGTIQEVLLQNLVITPGTPFKGCSPPNKDVMLKTFEVARNILPDDVTINVPFEHNPNIEDFIRAGLRDLGRIFDSPSVEQNEQVNNRLKALSETFGFVIQQRFPLNRDYIKEGRYSKKLGQVFDSYKYKIKKEGQEKAKVTRGKA